jgi:hypothetical protein
MNQEGRRERSGAAYPPDGERLLLVVTIATLVARVAGAGGQAGVRARNRIVVGRCKQPVPPNGVVALRHELVMTGPLE